jgi:hypothetical protein
MACFIAGLCLHGALMAELQFSEVSEAVGAAYTHDLVSSPVSEVDESEGGGVAAGDYDNDGHVDLYLITGDASDNVLLHNNGSGGFTNETVGSGVALSGHWSSGPVFADIDGDGWQDLLVGSMQGEGYYVFINDRDGTFTDASAQSNIVQEAAGQNDISSGLGDVDNDGDLDLFIGHHSFSGSSDRNHLWVNNGQGVFSAGDEDADINAFLGLDMSFAATFVDIDNDGWQDLLVTADSSDTEVYLNDRDGTFTNITTSAINDQFGMGSAPADYDNDGDIDWFVTSIHDHPDSPGTSRTGNRLYINGGSGIFTEESTTAGVRMGYWGWAACAADFDNDGWLDIFHVNGFHNILGQGEYFLDDPSRLFMNDHDTTFTERSAEANLVDTGQGRAIVCFDYDHDGDIDIFVFNVTGPTRLYQNDLTENPGYLQIDVLPEETGKTVAGAVIEIDTGSLTQTRQITVGSNFESQNPLRQHFGLGGAVVVDEVRVTWPSGNQAILHGVDINQVLVVQPEAPILADGFES